MSSQRESNGEFPGKSGSAPHKSSSSKKKMHSKKHSWNHLLNFSLTKEEEILSPYDYQFIKRKRNFVPEFNREQFVLANYNFVVRPPSQVNNSDSSKYYMTMHDPDLLVDWKTIEFVRFKSTTPVICAICLEQPSAPQITRCGHIFCYPCILHYLMLDNTKSWKKCPTCNDSVYVDALKSVVIEYKKEFKVGDTISFTLMQRPKGSIIGQQKSRGPYTPSDSIYPVDTDPDARFARYNSTYDIKKITRKELAELKTAMEAAISDSEISYITLAQQYVKQREAEWTKWAKKNIPGGPPKQHTLETKKSSPRSPISPKVSAVEEAFGEKEVERPAPQKNEADDYYYYYQSDDEQMLFLSPVNMKMLLFDHESDFTKLPTSIKATILEIEKLKLSEKNRKMFKFLNHIPLEADFAFVECDLSKHVSIEAMKEFSSILETRKRKRERKAKQERLEKELEKRREEEERLQRIKEREYQLQLLKKTQEHYPELNKGESPPSQHQQHSSWGLKHIVKSPKETLEEEFPELGGGSTSKSPPKQTKQQLGAWGRPNKNILWGPKKEKQKRKVNEFPTLSSTFTSSSSPPKNKGKQIIHKKKA